MVQFWLDNVQFLINTQNFNFNNVSPSQRQIQMLNIIAMLSLITGITIVYIKRDPKYFGIAVIVMASTILIKSNLKVSTFSNVKSILDSTYNTGAYLVRPVNGQDPSGLNNLLYVNQVLNLNRGDIIALANNNTVFEVNTITDIKYTLDTNLPVLVLAKPLEQMYSKYTTIILKVSENGPSIIPPPDGNISIKNAGNNYTSDGIEMAKQGFPQFNLPNQNRNDWNLQQSSMLPGGTDGYVYQGQPYGNLKARNSDINNPMGTINVTEYDSPPTMYGTSNVAEMTDGVYNDTVMTRNQEATVSQRVDDLLFHKGNSQMSFSPMPVDTLPNNQEAFANFCYNNPTNMLNVKYASIFVNDPEKYKLVSSLTKATGTEGGSGNR